MAFIKLFRNTRRPASKCAYESLRRHQIPNMMFWRAFFILLLLAKLHQTLQESTKSVFSEMSELSELCPYTPFCYKNASSALPYSNIYEPCCKPCSCDSVCGFRGDCCFSEIDILYTEGFPTVVCKSNVVNSPEPPQENGYRMISTCMFADKHPNGTCEHASSTFHPVVSRSTGFVYVNAFCALCNNVSDAVPWQRAITCHNPGIELPLTESLENYISEKSPAGLHGCQVFYIPPSDFEHSLVPNCNKFNINTCKALQDDQDSQSQKLCEKFNATFTVQTRGIVISFSNVYCFLCNLRLANSEKNDLCLKSEYLQNNKGHSEFELTVLLDLPTHDRITVPETEKENGVCPSGSVLVSSFTKSCRQLKCPWGQILLQNRCGYFSKLWSGSFSVMLRLVPIKRTAMIPSSFFDDLPERYKTDRLAPWIKRKTLKRWNLLVFYHPHREKPGVEYIVVKATLPSRSINPEYLKTMVKKALKDTWRIQNLNSSFDVMVKFNEYFKYVLVNEITSIPRKNTTKLIGYYPNLLFCYEKSVGKSHYKELLYPVTTFATDEIIAGIPVTKLLLCDQIDLLPDEYQYDDICRMLFFKVRNTTIEHFSIIRSYNERLTKKRLKVTAARVCLHEFDQTYNTGSVTPIHSVMLFTVIHFSMFSKFD